MSARTTAQALDSLALQQFELVLLNLYDGELDSDKVVQFLRRGKHSNSLVPVVGMTANLSQEQVSTALRSGVNDIVSKPVKIRDVARICWYWLRCETTSPGSTKNGQ